MVSANGEQLRHFRVIHASAVVDDNEIGVAFRAKVVEAHAHVLGVGVGAVVNELGHCAERPRMRLVREVEEE